MSGFARRALLRSVGLSITLGGFQAAQAQHVHALAAEEKSATGTFQPKAFNEHEFRTLQKLSDFIVPADAHSEGALAAGAADWIDLLASQNPELAGIYTGGILWLRPSLQAPLWSHLPCPPPPHATPLLCSIFLSQHESS